jgi:hypothetical protein
VAQRSQPNPVHPSPVSRQPSGRIFSIPPLMSRHERILRWPTRRPRQTFALLTGRGGIHRGLSGIPLRERTPQGLGAEEEFATRLGRRRAALRHHTLVDARARVRRTRLGELLRVAQLHAGSGQLLPTLQQNTINYRKLQVRRNWGISRRAFEDFWYKP